MVRRSLPLIASGLLALAGGPAALAAGPAKPVPPTKAQLDDAAFRFKVLISGLQSKDVSEEIKNRLFICLFENSMQKISDATGKVIAANKLDGKDPNKVFGAMAGVCGFRPEAPATVKPK